MQTMGLQMVSGRMFDHNRQADYEAAIVNEELAEEMGWDAQGAIGKHVLSDGRPYTVIGVVRNFKQFGMRQAIPPVSMHLVPINRIYTMAIKANPADHDEVRDYLESKWYETFPNMPFYSIEMEEMVRGRDVRDNERMATLFLLLALVATTLSAVGLFALVSLRIVARAKEIGIRKIMGAPLSNLIMLINQEFLTILVVALIVGSAIGYYLSSRMLNEMYAFHIGFDATAALVAVIAVVLTAALTVGTRVFGAATANPVDSLRSE
jgi:ABC-type antimicrobial peptide transport system permease subunit